VGRTRNPMIQFPGTGPPERGVSTRTSARSGRDRRAKEAARSRASGCGQNSSGEGFRKGAAGTGEYEFEGVPDRWHLYRVVG